MNQTAQTCVLVLDNLRSVENTGSLFRTAEGLGVAKLVCIGTTPTPLDRFGRKRNDFAKVSLESEDTLAWEYAKEIGPVLKELQEQGFEIIALEQTEKSEDLKSYEAPAQFALVVGNEVAGVSPEALALADTTLEIPMRGAKESLNVSVSTGIALFALLS